MLSPVVGRAIEPTCSAVVHKAQTAVAAISGQRRARWHAFSQRRVRGARLRPNFFNHMSWICAYDSCNKPSAVFDHVDSPDRSTSELTVSDCIGDRLGKLYGRMRHHHGYKRGMADASTSRVRGSLVVLRFVVTLSGAAL